MFYISDFGSTGWLLVEPPAVVFLTVNVISEMSVFIFLTLMLVKLFVSISVV